ncbi:MAG TPA: hypothetical protein VFS10_03205 [Pyrinomonadaceae bacterium]|nr:hypothetical protein [Pyrinomonadaceae bacterium]
MRRSSPDRQRVQPASPSAFCNCLVMSVMEDLFPTPTVRLVRLMTAPAVAFELTAELTAFELTVFDVDSERVLDAVFFELAFFVAMNCLLVR